VLFPIFLLLCCCAVVLLCCCANSFRIASSRTDCIFLWGYRFLVRGVHRILLEQCASVLRPPCLITSPPVTQPTRLSGYRTQLLSSGDALGMLRACLVRVFCLILGFGFQRCRKLQFSEFQRADLPIPYNAFVSSSRISRSLIIQWANATRKGCYIRKSPYKNQGGLLRVLWLPGDEDSALEDLDLMTVRNTPLCYGM
jgi:hypothetical protein